MKLTPLRFASVNNGFLIYKIINGTPPRPSNSYRRKLAVESPLLYQKVQMCKHCSRCTRRILFRCEARSEQWRIPWDSSSVWSRWCTPGEPRLRHVLREWENCNCLKFILNYLWLNKEWYMVVVIFRLIKPPFKKGLTF